jgi:hypothetical protein
MSFFDVFNLSFVVYLGILILCLSLLFVYFESKLREQNHKMASILQIVSTLAQEVHSSPPLTTSVETTYPLQTFDDVKKVNSSSLELIDVSDGEEDKDDDEDGYEEEEDEDEDEEMEDLDAEESESESGSESASESGSESDSDFEEDVTVLAENLDIEPEVVDFDDDDVNKTRESPVLVVKLSSAIEPEFDEYNLTTTADLIPSDEFKAEFDDFHVVTGGDDDAHSISSDFGENESKVDEIKSQDLKSIILSANISVHDGAKSLSADEGSVVGDEFTKDFKKMSQNKLKKLAIEKGLIQENSKLKKPELISLLEKSL